MSYLTVDQVAEKLGRSKRTIHRMVKDPEGGLRKIGETASRGWKIDPESEALKTKEGEAGE